MCISLVAQAPKTEGGLRLTMSARSPDNAPRQPVQATPGAPLPTV
eukprot:COSAG04_NODE_19225_length_421_cov_0.965839_1_plen_44_part_01